MKNLSPLRKSVNRKTDELFEAFFHRGKEALLIINREFRVLSANPAAITLLGCQRDQLIGNSLNRIVECVDFGSVLEKSGLLDGWTEAYRRELKADVEGVCELRFMDLRKDDYFAVEIISVRENEAALRRLKSEAVIAFEEASEERSKRRQLEYANQRLQSFTYRAAHDLRGPLRRIKQALELYRTGIDDGDQRLPPILELAEDSASELYQLVNSLLEYSSRMTQPVQKAELNFTDVIEKARHIVSDEALADDWLRIEATPIIRGDADLLTIVFANLLSNAVRYQSAERDLKVKIAAETTGDELEISVSDNGIGFAPEDARRLFQLFERAHAGVDGHGIGLATCSEIISNHGWSIDAEGEPDNGAVFTIHIPWCDVVSVRG